MNDVSVKERLRNLRKSSIGRIEVTAESKWSINVISLVLFGWK